MPSSYGSNMFPNSEKNLNAFPNDQPNRAASPYRAQNFAATNQNYFPPQYQHASPLSQPGHSELSALTDATNRIGTSSAPFTTLSTSSSLSSTDPSRLATSALAAESIPVTSVSSAPATSNTMVTQSITSPVTSITENSNSSSTDTQIQPDVFMCGPPLIHPATVDSRPPPPKKKSSGDLSRLYEMGNEPDRRYFLDKLIMYLDERCAPITMMPCISKQPLDLYKLYLLVREKGGMVEVTRLKKWKEICSLVNISASASAAFTLKKNYIKYLFSYECHFDRGGMNPAPVLAQMEAQLRQKRESKNRRDNPSGTAQDAYRASNTPDVYTTGMPQFMPPEQMPPGNMMGQHTGMMQSGLMPPNNYMTPPPPNASSQPGNGAVPNSIPQPGRDNISVTDPFSDEAQTASQYRYNAPTNQMSQFASVPPPQSDSSRLTPNDQFADRYPHSQSSNSSTPEPGRTSADQFRPSPGPYSNSASFSSDRPDQAGVNPSGNYRPTPPPDHIPFQNRPYDTSSKPPDPSTMYPTGGQYPSAGYHGTQQQRMGREYNTPSKKYPEMDRRDSFNVPPDSRRDACWSPMQNNRSYPPQNNPSMMPGSPQMSQFNRHHPRMSPQRPDKNYSPSKLRKPMTGGPVMEQFNSKRDLHFPPGSVEATQPLTVKRRKVTSKDIGFTDPWRIMLALKSGLLAESTWALNTLSFLLCDESAMLYFGLVHLPGLLDTLLDHYRRLLIEIFGKFDDSELKTSDTLSVEKSDTLNDSNLTIVDSSMDTSGDEEGGEKGIKLEVDDTGSVIAGDDDTLGQNKMLGNYTMVSRHGRLVKVEESSQNDARVCEMDRGFASGLDHWALGKADTTAHVVCHFESRTTRSVMKRSFYNYCTKHCHECLDSLEVCDNWSGCCEKKARDSASLSGGFDGAKSEGIADNCDKDGDRASQNPAETLENDQRDDIQVKLEPTDSSSSGTDCHHACGSEVMPMESTPFGVKSEDKKEPDVGMEYLRGQKRLMEEQSEEEAYERDNPSLSLSSAVHIELSGRCLAVSNIIRSLSFLPGNDVEMSKHAGLLNILGELLLFHHEHLPHLRRKRQFDKNDDNDEVVDLTHGQSEWWWTTVQDIREDALICLSNISARLNLAKFPESICMRILDGLLHWSVCPSAYARDPLTTSNSFITAQSLVLETMCKLSVHKVNIDLLIATSPFSRIIQLITILVRLLSNKKPQTQQEFAIVLLAAMVQSDSSISRVAALQHPCISLLIDFLECAEQNALQVANTHGVSTLRDNPEVMGTSLDMLRRAASTLGYLARNSHNRSLFVRHESRILALVMSQILDQHVAQLLSDVLFECSKSK